MRRAPLLLVTWALACATRAAGSPPTSAPVASTEPAPVPAPVDAATAPTTTEPAAPTETPDAVPGPDIAGYAPLSDEQRALLQSIPTDPPAQTRLGVTPAQEGRHYLAGNEKTPQAFRAKIADLGGGYVGVGSDQAYLFIGWMRPHVAWLADYDADVVAIHEVYRLFFAHAETPAQMLALWDRPARERAVALIRDAHDGERGDHLVGLYLTNRGWIHRRLRGLSRRLARAHVDSWLGDQATYDFVRDFVASGRAQPVLANLLGAEGIRGIAASARALGVEIKVVYMSNAEEYWPAYTDDFRANIAALPFADDAIVLRTLLTWDVNQDYRYNTQRADNFLRWLDEPYIGNVYDITHARPDAIAGQIIYFETDSEPGASPAARRAAAASSASG